MNDDHIPRFYCDTDFQEKLIPMMMKCTTILLLCDI